MQILPFSDDIGEDIAENEYDLEPNDQNSSDEILSYNSLSETSNIPKTPKISIAQKLRTEVNNTNIEDKNSVLNLFDSMFRQVGSLQAEIETKDQIQQEEIEAFITECLETHSLNQAMKLAKEKFCLPDNYHAKLELDLSF